jgi:hypothetical protein
MLVTIVIINDKDIDFLSLISYYYYLPKIILQPSSPNHCARRQDCAEARSQALPLGTRERQGF